MLFFLLLHFQLERSAQLIYSIYCTSSRSETNRSFGLSNTLDPEVQSLGLKCCIICKVTWSRTHHTQLNQEEKQHAYVLYLAQYRTCGGFSEIKIVKGANKRHLSVCFEHIAAMMAFVVRSVVFLQLLQRHNWPLGCFSD